MTLLLALLLDAAMGEPRRLWSRLPHPVVATGWVIDRADRRFNHGTGQGPKGVLLCLGLVLGAGLAGLLVPALPLAPLWEMLLVAILIAHRSLVDHVRAVADALRLSVGDGRMCVAMIVGRDTGGMDRPAVARAAIESAAENFSDGVVAPVFWYLIAGLPGILICKTINTADSMIGHRSPRHEAFGRASARLDDVLNWIPARLTALILVLTEGAWRSIRTIVRDARLHRSPNAGWPEAAMALSLGVALAGPRSYAGETRDFPLVHPEGRRDAGPDDIDAAIRILWRGWAAILGLTLIGVLTGALFRTIATAPPPT